MLKKSKNYYSLHLIVPRIKLPVHKVEDFMVGHLPGEDEVHVCAGQHAAPGPRAHSHASNLDIKMYIVE